MEESGTRRARQRLALTFSVFQIRLYPLWLKGSVPVGLHKGVSAFPIVPSFFRFTSDDKQPHDAMPKRHERGPAMVKAMAPKMVTLGSWKKRPQKTHTKAKRDSVQTKQVSRTLFCVVQLVVDGLIPPPSGCQQCSQSPSLLTSKVQPLSPYAGPRVQDLKF